MIAGEQLAYVVANPGSGWVVIGLDGLLERRVGDEWVSCRGAPSRLPRVSIGPGERRELTATIPTDAAAGRYRISQKVTLASRPGWAGHRDPAETVSFEFDVLRIDSSP